MNDLSKAAFGLIGQEFEEVLRLGGEEAKAKAEVISDGVARYWLLAAMGNPGAKKNMDFLQSELELFVTRFNVNANAALKAGAARWLDVVAQVGQILVAILLSKGVLL